MEGAGFSTNVLLLGKTGVGKSSLLNYLFDKPDTARTGVGKPVTEEGLHKHPPFKFKDMELVIYDSWGMEPDKTPRWKSIILDEVRRNSEKSIRDWFHTIIYCIDAKKSRIDNGEMEIIDGLANEGNRLLFALTRADVASEKEIAAVKDFINGRWHFPQVPVCSIEKKLFKGSTKSFGREDMFKGILSNLSTNLFSKGLIKFEADLKKELDWAINDVIEYFDRKAGSLGLFTSYGDAFRNAIESRMNDKFAQAQEHALNSLLSNLRAIALLEATISLNLGRNIAKSMEEKLVKINHAANLSSYSTWDNSFENNFAELITSVLFLPFLPFIRKDMYLDDLKKCCDNAKQQILGKHMENVAQSKKNSFRDKDFTVATSLAACISGNAVSSLNVLFSR